MGWLRRRFPALLMARRNIGRTKVRSVLAALGIVIGVIAIASLGMFGLTLRYQLTENLGDIGNQVMVTPADSSGAPGALTERDLRQVESLAGSGATVAPAVQRFTTVSYGRGAGETRAVMGIDQPGKLFEAREGSIPEPYRSGALIGPNLADQRDLGPGDTITVNGSTERVVAVLSPSQGFGFTDPSDQIVLPTRTFDSRGYDTITVTETDSTAANATAVAIRAQLNDRRERVSVQDFSGVADQIGQSFQAVNLFLIGIGSISLLVAGVSILNVMLMSAVERRQEIGVLRAVGFQKRDVLKIMLSEAVLLGIVGGLAGAGFSIVAGMALNHFVVGDASLVFRPGNFVYIGLAFAFGVGTSLLSGLYPAWKAANERPVEALRG
ncbi:ABC transporter permease [Halosimplex carlsbadense 2-9-1]|uniref:ABC transporter permease n=1 Tax=Halosimplex carlsbadense 2-9-1 TaxID=797114 RepID=M0CUQ9_9EURY|nr:ABC transporter permease [Halosimplex carlsbadense]ELZ25614.1 ABC transporter permease [Halosimplex carlsbadense 2-9-1]